VVDVIESWALVTMRWIRPFLLVLRHNSNRRNETWLERYVIGGHPNFVLLNSLQSVIATWRAHELTGFSNTSAAYRILSDAVNRSSTSAQFLFFIY